MENLRNVNTRNSISAMAGRILEDARVLAAIHAGELFEDNSSSCEQDLILQTVWELKESSRLLSELLKRSDPSVWPPVAVVGIVGTPWQPTR